MIAALAFAWLREWGQAIKAIVGAGLNALLGGIKLTKQLEYLEGGLGGLGADMLLYRLRPYGVKAWRMVDDLATRRTSFVPTKVNKMINTGAAYLSNLVGNLIMSIVPPAEESA